MSNPQWTETNLLCTLNSPLGATDTSCACTCVDRVSGLARTPLSTTKIWVIDKGTTNLPNINYEIVYGISSTAIGITTITFDPNGRKLLMEGSSLVGNSVADPSNPTHIAGAEVGTVDVHYLSTINSALLDGTDSIDSNLNFGGVNTFNGAGIWRDRVFANAAARNAAIAAPLNGESCYLTAEGKFTDYVGGAWVDRASGVNPNADETTAGKVELATLAEIQAGTSLGGTGARLVPPNDTLYTYINAAILNTGIVGEMRMWTAATPPAGWLLCEGLTIGNAASGATARANADTVTLFTLLWNNFADAQLAVTGGRGLSAAADFAANKAIALPDMKGRGPMGLNSGTFNVNGKTGGEETHTMTTAELASHTHAVTGTTNGGGGYGGTNGAGPNGTYSLSVSFAGTSVPFNVLQPYFTVRFILKY